jgi:hypothetical protein
LRDGRKGGDAMNTGAIKSRDWWILAALTVVSVRTHAQDAQQAPALSPALPAPTPAEPVPPATPDLPTASPTTTAAGLQPEVAATAPLPLEAATTSRSSALTSSRH